MRSAVAGAIAEVDLLRDLKKRGLVIAPKLAVGDGALRAKGHEFGTTTGRPRRCGWYDAVAIRYSTRINGLDALAATSRRPTRRRPRSSPS